MILRVGHFCPTKIAVHRPLLNAHSQLLTTFGPPFGKCLYLANEDADAVRCYVRLIYIGKIACIIKPDTRTVANQLADFENGLLSKLYVFSLTIEDVRAQNAATDAMLQLYHSRARWRTFSCPALISCVARTSRPRRTRLSVACRSICTPSIQAQKHRARPRQRTVTNAFSTSRKDSCSIPDLAWIPTKVNAPSIAATITRIPQS